MDEVTMYESRLVQRALAFELLERFPDLTPFYRECVDEGHQIASEFVPEWLRRRVLEFGEYVSIAPLPMRHPARTVRARTEEEYRAVNETFALALAGYWFDVHVR
jgi:hypothetical protein